MKVTMTSTRVRASAIQARKETRRPARRRFVSSLILSLTVTKLVKSVLRTRKLSENRRQTRGVALSESTV